MPVTHNIRDPQGKRHKVTVDPDLAWLLPYVTLSRRYGIPIWRLKEIKGYYVPEGKAEAQKAQTILHEGTSKFVITLLKFTQTVSGDGKNLHVVGYTEASQDFMFENTLQTLAHELAHLVHWDHGPERFVLEARVMLGFAKLAHRLGYGGYGQ